MTAGINRVGYRLGIQRARLTEQEKFFIRSPIAGEVRELVEPLAPGDWLRSSSFLAAIVADNPGRVEAWIAESELSLISEGAPGMFYPDDIVLAPFAFNVQRIDEASTRQLMDLYQSSQRWAHCDAAGPFR